MYPLENIQAVFSFWILYLTVIFTVGEFHSRFTLDITMPGESTLDRSSNLY